MPKAKTAQTNHAEESAPRARRRRGATAAANQPANDKLGANRQLRSDPAPSKPSKQQLCLDLLRRLDGASVEQLQAATGWQPHSVRGFLSGTVKNKLGLTLTSDRAGDGCRRYRVGSETAAS